MLKLTRKFGLGVLVFVIVPIAIACYGIITGAPILADQGRGIVLLIGFALAAMAVFSVYAASTIDMTATEKVQARVKEMAEKKTSGRVSTTGKQEVVHP